MTATESEEQAGVEEVAAVAPAVEVFKREDMGQVRRKSVPVPLWNGKYAYAHEPTLIARTAWGAAAQRGEVWNQTIWLIEAFLGIVKDGPDETAQPIFNRADWRWLESQSAGVIENAVQAAVALGVPDQAAFEAMKAFFGQTPGGSKSAS